MRDSPAAVPTFHGSNRIHPTDSFPASFANLGRSASQCFGTFPRRRCSPGCPKLPFPYLQTKTIRLPLCCLLHRQLFQPLYFLPDWSAALLRGRRPPDGARKLRRPLPPARAPPRSQTRCRAFRRSLTHFVLPRMYRSCTPCYVSTAAQGNISRPHRDEFVVLGRARYHGCFGGSFSDAEFSAGADGGGTDLTRRARV